MFSKIRTKLTVIFGSVSIFSFLIVGMLYFLLISNVIDEKERRNLKNITEGIYNLAQTAYRINQERVDYNLNVADSYVRGAAMLAYNKYIGFNIENQITHKRKFAAIPKMYLRNHLLSKTISLVDRITKLIGGTVTIFQVIPEGLLRISTSVKKLDRNRAIGTYIPVDSPVYKAVMKGRVFRGRAFEVNDWYITAFKPIRDKRNRIIGAVYVGVKQTDLKHLRKQILGIKIGETGYASIIDNKGTVVIHPVMDEGENLWNQRSANGGYFIQKMINKSRKNIGKLLFKKYDLMDVKRGETSSREKITAYKYLKEMEWMISAESYTDELLKSFNRLRFGLFIIAAIAVLITFIIVYVVSKSITKPINSMYKMADSLAKGDLTQRLKVTSQDEIGNVAVSFLKMADNLQDIIENIMLASDQVLFSSEDLSKTAGSVSEGAQKQAMSLADVTANSRNQVSSVEDVTLSIVQLNTSIQGVYDLSKKVKSGSEDALVQATAAKSASTQTITAMEEIEGSSIKIKDIINLITDIADQTNLLALNASIEAARAGESGHGFAVVAKEISKLADKSAEASKDIEDLINETGKNVVNGSAMVRNLSDSISVMKNISEASATYGEEMSKATEEQLNGSRHISNAMEEVNNLSKEIAMSAESVNSVTQDASLSAQKMAVSSEELSNQADKLKKTIEHFKIR